MKTRVLGATMLAFLALLFPATAFSYNEEPAQTLFSGDDIHVSGYGGPTFQFTSIKGDFGLLLGGRGGVIINDSFVIGGAGYGMALPSVSVPIDGTDKRLAVGYGGLLLEYFFYPKELVNYSVGTLIGGGGVGEMAERGGERNAFFVLQPEANVYVNVTRFFRIGAGAAYRFSNGINQTGFTDADFRGFSGLLNFEFGRF